MLKSKKSISLVLIAMLLTISLLGGCAPSTPAETTAPATTMAKTEAPTTAEATTATTTAETTTLAAETTAATETNEALSLKFAMPAGAPTISIIKAMKEQPAIADGVTVEYEMVKSPDLMASKLIKGELAAAIVPSNLAIKLYNKGIDYKYAATGVWGILYIVGNEEVNGWQDLKGKTITMIGRGLTPDIVTRHLLKANGLEPDVDVTFEYVDGATNLAPMFISGKSSISIMPEPMLSKVMTKKQDSKILFDLQAEWKNATGTSDSYPQAGMLIKGDIIANHPMVAKALLDTYNESITWVNQNPTEVSTYADELKIGTHGKLISKALPRMNLMFKNAIDSKTALETYYQVLFDASPKAIGGKMPDDNFYFVID